MDFNSAKPRAEKPSTIAGLAVALLFSMGLAVVGSIAGMIADAGNRPVGVEMAYDFGQAIGAGVFSAVVVWGVLHFAYVNRVAPERGGRHLLIMVLASVAAALTPLVLAVSMMSVSERAPRPVLTSDAKGDTAVSFLSGRPPPGIETIVAAYRAKSETERVAAERARRGVLGVGLVQAHALAQRNSLEDLRGQLVSLRTETDQAFARQEVLLTELEASVRKETQPNARRRGLRWVATEQRLRRDRLEMLHARLEEVFDETEAMIELLAKDRSAWRIENGKIAFANDADLVQMRRHSERLDQLAFEIDQIEGDFEREATRDAE